MTGIKRPPLVPHFQKETQLRNFNEQTFLTHASAPEFLIALNNYKEAYALVEFLTVQRGKRKNFFLNNAGSRNVNIENTL